MRKNTTSAHGLADLIQRLTKTIAAKSSHQALTELGTALEELKAAEKTLEVQTQAFNGALQRADDERRRYLELFEFAPDGYGVTDTHGVILEANVALRDLLGKAGDGVLGKPLFVFVMPDQQRDLQDFVTKVVQDPSDASPSTSRVWRSDFTINRNPPLLVSARCRVSRDIEGRISRLLWLLRDVTAERRAEEVLKHSERDLKRALEAKTFESHGRLTELERFHDVAVGRELRLMELENRIKALETPPSDDE